MSLADRLKQVRDSRGFTQKEMAKAISTNPQTWQVYEAGKSVPGGNVLEALARMGFNVNWILTGVGPMKLNTEEMRRLLCEEAHDKLKAKIRSIATTPSRLYSVETFPFEQIEAYLKGDYWPDYDQILSLCKRAGAAFSDKEFIDVVTSVDMKHIERDIIIENRDQSNSISKTIDENILHDVLKGISEAFEDACSDDKLNTTRYSLEDLTELIAFCYDASINDADTTSSDYKKTRVKRLVALLNKGYQSREHADTKGMLDGSPSR